jgi:transposase
MRARNTPASSAKKVSPSQHYHRSPSRKASQPGLLAHIAVSKYQDALPLYRQQAVLQRARLIFLEHLCRLWMIKTGELLQPVLTVLEKQLLTHPVMHYDETVVQILKEPNKQATSQSYMWVRVGGSSLSAEYFG